jgi:hypothetical protein
MNQGLGGKPLPVLAPRDWFESRDLNEKIKMSFSEGVIDAEFDDQMLVLLIESNGVEVVGFTENPGMIPLLKEWNLSDGFWCNQWDAEPEENLV